MRTALLVFLSGLLCVCALLGLGAYREATTDPKVRAQQRLETARLGCMSRVGIRRDPPELYTATKARYVAPFAFCMLERGYQGEDLVP